jgi:hypothetical protein
LANIFWDTNLFIYLVEDKGALADRVAELWTGMQERGDRLYTSAFTLGEQDPRGDIRSRNSVTQTAHGFCFNA